MSAKVIEEKKYLTKKEAIAILRTIKDVEKKIFTAINIDERRIGDGSIDKEPK